MEYKKFNNKYLVRIDKGEEILNELKTMCKKENIKLATVSAIGAVCSAEIGWFNINEKKYYSEKYNGIYEIGSLSGTVSTMNDEVYLHIHTVLAGIGHTVISGHLNRATVSATCELVLDMIDGKANREFSNEIGLNLLSFNE